MQTVLITGANKSIGFETAKQLAAQGYFVFLGSRDIKKGEAAADQLKAAGYSQVQAVQINVADPASVAAAKDTVSKQISSLDILINNAGIMGGYQQMPSAISPDVLHEVFNTNFFGAVHVTQAFMELLKKSGAPRIVNVTSGLASLTLHSDPAWKYYAIKSAAYGPSKTALNAYTVALAYELRDTAFKINAVDPGYTATDFNQHRGTGSVENAARIIVKYALTGADGPTGKYFSNDINGESDESPW
ncbi:MAG TPA: SDR family oxidoreductase [Chitinophaga sp.]|uniref:SDR family oxidoreductase n=1 Tax=Chitinophaga sp. TaxID=1869181 RepID=UPI002DB58ABC|nr:SDR family oxidoreductase [Chitinophaga sp.]HEU4551584.1 SDR family oxidoreductase [Chitinophaga sp.]